MAKEKDWHKEYLELEYEFNKLRYSTNILLSIIDEHIKSDELYEMHAQRLEREWAKVEDRYKPKHLK